MDNRFLKIIKITACGILFISIFSVAVMLLWNWLIPAIFKGPEITFIQALGFLVLSKILLGGFGGGRCNCQQQGNKHFWKQKFYEKMQRMSPEEKEKFKSKFARCFQGSEPPSVSEKQ